MRLNKHHLPDSLHALIPVAEEWGLSDQADQSDKVHKSTSTALVELLKEFDDRAQYVFRWLEEHATDYNAMIDEYVAFTDLVMATDLARLRLKREFNIDAYRKYEFE